MVTFVRAPGRDHFAVTGGFGLILILVGLPVLRAQGPETTPPARVVVSAPTGHGIAAGGRSAGDRSRSTALYRAHCLECHETDGRGESSRELMRRIPDFTRPDWQGARRDDQLLVTIRDGKGMMPPMKDQLGTREMALLVALIRDFRGGGQVISEEEPEASPRPPEPRRATGPAGPDPRPITMAPRPASEPAVRRSDGGRRVFQRLCVACHGADGHGTAMRAQIPGIPDLGSPGWQSRRTDAQLATSIREGRGTAMPAFGGRLGEAQVREVIAYLRSLVPADVRSARAPSDFRRRFEELREEIERQDRQYDALSRP